jgi:hypothetical protein
MGSTGGLESLSCGFFLWQMVVGFPTLAALPIPVGLKLEVLVRTLFHS